MSRKLSLKQQRFIAVFIKTRNASEAYRQAYDADGMSDETIKVEACRLLKNPNIAPTISQALEKAAEKLDISIERTLDHLGAGAFGTPSDELKWSDKLSALDKMMKHLGGYEKDNAQQRDNLAIQIALVAAPGAPR